MLTLVKKIDNANGYVFGGKHEEGNLSEMLSYAAGAEFEYFKYPSLVISIKVTALCIVVNMSERWLPYEFSSQ